MNHLTNFPPGYSFSPNDQQVMGYLYHKIVGQPNPHFQPLLPVIDFYAMEPPLIWKELGGIDGHDLYFFTMLKKKKSRIVRKVGSDGGTWSGENKATRVFSSTNDRDLMGAIKRFHFENNKLKVKDQECSWTMYEYTLDPTFLPKGIVHDSYVLCKIRKRKVNKEKETLPTTTIHSYTFQPSMIEYDHNPRPSQVVNHENQCGIRMNVGLMEDKMNQLESAELAKNIRPSRDNQLAGMRYAFMNN